MGADQQDEEARREAEQCPTAWFSALEAALRRNDFAAAERARRKLRRLGVRVRFDFAAVDRMVRPQDGSRTTALPDHAQGTMLRGEGGHCHA